MLPACCGVMAIPAAPNPIRDKPAPINEGLPLPHIIHEAMPAGMKAISDKGNEYGDLQNANAMDEIAIPTVERAVTDLHVLPQLSKAAAHEAIMRMAASSGVKYITAAVSVNPTLTALRPPNLVKPLTTYKSLGNP